MKFTKMHGSGNDYIFINTFEEGNDHDWPHLARMMSDRHFGIGSDGIILIMPSRKADFRMRIFNADGSEGEMCGNGIRCFARYLYEHGMTKDTAISVETLAGIVRPSILLDGDTIKGVKVNMGEPRLLAEQIPVLGPVGQKIINHPLSVNGQIYRITCVSMGNPHCVVFVNDLSSVDVSQIGPLIENHRFFPARVNVEFVQVNSGNDISMAVWERGSGITLACGTGASASVVAGVLNGLNDRACTVRLAGGNLHVEWGQDNCVYMTGPAEEVFTGEYIISTPENNLEGGKRYLRTANRIDNIPPYLFAEVDKKKADAKSRGVDLIDLGIGDPDMPTPPNIIARLCETAKDPGTHRYPPYEGDSLFRKAMANYYMKRFGVEVDRDKQVMTLIGSKEGLAHIIWAFVDKGDYALVPDPAYPVYKTHTLLAGGIPYSMPLKAENGWMPDLGSIPEEVVRKAKIMFLNYPNNPTAGIASRKFFEEAVAFARANDIVLCHDAAYVEMTYDGYVAPSILEIEGALDVCVEFYSLSKPFNMTGWRIGAAVGNEDILYKGLGIIKTNTDSGQFRAIQWAGVEALESDPAGFIARMNQVYLERRDALVEGLNKQGWNIVKPSGSFYVWAKVPNDSKSGEFAETLLEKAGVVVVPGGAYGDYGEGYIRMALTVDVDKINEAVKRISGVL